MKDRAHCQKTIYITSSSTTKTLKEMIQNGMQTCMTNVIYKSSMIRHRRSKNDQGARRVAKVKKQVSAQTKSRNVWK